MKLIIVAALFFAALILSSLIAFIAGYLVKHNAMRSPCIHCGKDELRHSNVEGLLVCPTGKSCFYPVSPRAYQQSENNQHK